MGWQGGCVRFGDDTALLCARGTMQLKEENVQLALTHVPWSDSLVLLLRGPRTGRQEP